MTREKLARPLSCFLECSQSARCCHELSEFECKLFLELLHREELLSLVLFLLLNGTAEIGA
jgi:predicted transcriptional regulator